MARPVGGTKRIPGFRRPRLPVERILAQSLLNGGLMLDADLSDIQDNQSPLVVNARMRRDRTEKRPGRLTFLPTAPDALKINRIVDYEAGPNTLYRIRITPSSAHFTQGTAWTAFTGSLGGTVTDIATVRGSLVAATGAAKIKLLDVGDATISDIDSNAPQGKYLTGFVERLVTGNLGISPGLSETLAWSANRDITEYDTLEDISAGLKRLDTSPGEVLDPISGVYGFNTVMIIPREHSIWVGIPSGTASDPINTSRAIPKIGTSLPGSIAITRAGIIFLDTAGREVYRYSPGGQPEPLAFPVRNSILDQVADAKGVFSFFLENENEYYLGVDEIGSTKLWVYNFVTKAWEYDEVSSMTAINGAAILSDYTSFDEATGTFDAASGTFDDASATPFKTKTMVYGFSNGTLEQESDTVATDNSVAYTFERRTKEYRAEDSDMVFLSIVYEYLATVAGNMVLSYSKDGGTTWTAVKTITTTVTATKAQTIRFKKQIRAKRLMYRITSNSGLFDLLSLKVTVIGGGDKD